MRIGDDIPISSRTENERKRCKDHQGRPTQTNYTEVNISLNKMFEVTRRGRQRKGKKTTINQVIKWFGQTVIMLNRLGHLPISLSPVEEGTSLTHPETWQPLIYRS